MNKQGLMENSAVDPRVIVITGASSGIGEQAALQLAAPQNHLCLVARRCEELERVQAAVRAAGGAASIYPADLSIGEVVDQSAAAILADHGRVDVLVNNAGRSIIRSVADALDRDHDYQRTMQINYFAALRLCLRLLPKMLEMDRGHIINITSIAVQMSSPGFSAYVASKMALEGFSRVLNAEMAGSNVHVTLIRYPLVHTPMSSATDTYQHVPMMTPEKAASWIVRAVNEQPARIGTRVGELVEVANVVMPGLTERVTGGLYHVLAKFQKLRSKKIWRR
jgi:short-subunit dehydrogenase